MRARLATSLALALIAFSVGLSARQPVAFDLPTVLDRATQRVTEYFTRAQSLVCLEKVALQKLNSGLGADGMARVVESELRLSWEPTPENPVPKEAKTLRQVIKVNGGKPRTKDSNNCTTPEQNVEEEQPLSILLPQQRADYAFTAGGRDKVDGREAMVIAFRETRKLAVDVSMVDGVEDCVSFTIEGGARGKIWVDADTHDVLRLDRSQFGLVDIPLPKKVTRHSGNTYWTVERLDSSIRFKRITFDDPQETLVLPVSATALQVIRGGSRLRTSTQYLSYRRFMTGARVVPPQ